MKTYKVPVTFSFSGTFFITASSSNNAREKAEQHCGLVMGGGIHSSLPIEDVDWDFPFHPEKKTGDVTAHKDIVWDEL